MCVLSRRQQSLFWMPRGILVGKPALPAQRLALRLRNDVFGQDVAPRLRLWLVVVMQELAAMGQW